MILEVPVLEVVTIPYEKVVVDKRTEVEIVEKYREVPIPKIDIEVCEVERYIETKKVEEKIVEVVR